MSALLATKSSIAAMCGACHFGLADPMVWFHISSMRIANELKVTYATARGHKGDYGIDGFFRTITFERQLHSAFDGQSEPATVG